MDRMDEMDKKYVENMSRMSQNVEKLTESVTTFSVRFSLLKSFMFQQQGGTYPPQLYTMFSIPPWIPIIRLYT